MTDPLPRAIVTMMVALNARPDPERVAAFITALDDLQLCHRCAVDACRKLTAYLARRPMPRDLCMEVRDLMYEPDHNAHLAERALTPGDDDRWWQTAGREAVIAIWPDCPNPGWVTDQARRMGYIPAGDVSALMAEVGNPGTTERRWWTDHAARSLTP